VSHGILRYDVEKHAADDFEQAIRYGSTGVWPHFFLAHQNLTENRFDECRRMCERAVELAASEEVWASLFEWLAISQTDLGIPHELIQSAFEAAIRLAPDVDRIRRNSEESDNAATLQKVGPLHCARSDGLVVREAGRAGYSALTA